MAEVNLYEEWHVNAGEVLSPVRRNCRSGEVVHGIGVAFFPVTCGR